jgi:hypothetical protein
VIDNQAIKKIGQAPETLRLVALGEHIAIEPTYSSG